MDHPGNVRMTVRVCRTLVNRRGIARSGLLAPRLQRGSASTNLERPMHRNLGRSQTLSLGEIVTAACELGGIIAADPTVAAALAARHLERVLVRGSNAR